MDSEIKSDYLVSGHVRQNTDSGMVWEDQKRKWENQLMYTTQQLAAQFTPWLPMINPYQHPGLVDYTPVSVNPYQHTGLVDYTPVGVNWHYPPKVSNNDCLEGTPTNIKAAKTLDFTPTSSWHSPQTSNDDCCVRTPEELKTSKTQEFTPPPNTAIKCYVCDEHVLRSEFALHLFFGELRCNDCKIKILDCKSFRSDIFRSSNCIHKHLIWSENPIEYLKSQLHVTSKSDYKKVYRYVKRLKSLETLLPWKFIFQEYRRLKRLESNSKIKCEPAVCDINKCEEINTNATNCGEVLLLESYDLGQMEDAVQVVDLVDHELFKENYVNVQTKSVIPENKHTIKSEQILDKEIDTLHTDDKNIKKKSETESVKLSNQGGESKNINNILNNSPKTKYIKSDLENISIQERESKKNNSGLDNSSRAHFIKSAVENILLKEKLFKENKSKKDIICKQKQVTKSKFNNMKTSLNLTNTEPLKRKKRKYTKKGNIQNKSVEETSPMNSEVKLLDLPEDGNYLVTRTPIEECPMCYTKISPYNCRVNISLLLYTFWCPCGLKIFYLRKTPSNIEHPVKIILDK